MSWLDDRLNDAPEALALRVRELAAGSREPDRLAHAGAAALDAAVSIGSNRSAALDLLAADALITLALFRVGTSEPERLEEFASGLRRECGAE